MEKHPKHNLLSKDNFDRGAADGSMDYEQASIDSFDAASKAVAEKLQVRVMHNYYKINY